MNSGNIRPEFQEKARQFWTNTTALASGATSGIRDLRGSINKTFADFKIKTGQDIQNLSTQKIGEYFRESYLRRQQQIRNWKVAVTLGFVVIGMMLMVVALSLPEWFILIQFESIEGHVGFFHRCVYGPLPDTKTCLENTMSETATCVAMFIMALLSSLGAFFCGIYRVIKTKGRPKANDSQSTAFKRMRFLILTSAVCSFCGVGSFTYLYHNYLYPVAASYVLGWLATGFLLTGGLLGYCFEEKQDSESTVDNLVREKITESRQYCKVISPTVYKTKIQKHEATTTTKEVWNPPTIGARTSRGVSLPNLSKNKSVGVQSSS